MGVMISPTSQVVHSFHKQVLSTDFIQSILLGSEHTTQNKTEGIPASHPQLLTFQRGGQIETTTQIDELDHVAEHFSTVKGNKRMIHRDGI